MNEKKSALVRKSHDWMGYFNENLNKRSLAYINNKEINSKSQFLAIAVRFFLDTNDKTQHNEL